jgi:hypothetical protein
MSAQKRLSQLSVAAVALLVVALPCFAQTETPANQTEKTSAASVADGSAVVAVNRESAMRESRNDAKRVSDADTNARAPKFSADKFMQAVNELPATTIKRSSVFLSSTPKFDDKSSDSKGLTFVPSRRPEAPGVTF